MATRDEYVQWAYLSALVGGVLLIAAGVVGLLLVLFMGGMMGSGMRDGMDGMGGMGFFPFFFALMMGLFAVVIPVVTGAFSIHGARRVRDDPAAREKWGIILVIVGVASFLGGGGFALGGIAVIVGGFLALQAVRTPDAAAPAQ